MKVWSPLQPGEPFQFEFGQYAILILNRDITLPSSSLERLWNNAIIRSTADGGTDKWFRYIKSHSMMLTNIFPDIVSGDFDSISPETLEHCRRNGVYVEHTPDQNYTDFQKSLQVISKKTPTKLDSVVVVQNNGGRLDQLFENVNTLGKVADFMDDPPVVYLLGGSSITWHLPAGDHKICIPKYLIDRSVWCGILPYDPIENSITTTGLKWNLNNQCVTFGGLISSSNTYNGEPYVTISTNGGLLWTMGLD